MERDIVARLIPAEIHNGYWSMAFNRWTWGGTCTSREDGIRQVEAIRDRIRAKRAES